MRAGVIGLGTIGGGMAHWLREAGLPTIVRDLDPDRVRPHVARGAVAAGSLRELAAAADVISVVVRDDAQVRDVVLSPDGVLAGAARGAVIALHSTILPRTVLEVADAATARGVHVVDAPVTGGPAGAASGNLVYMVGGDPDVVEHCRPVFEPPSKQIILTGPLGSGAGVKLCNNLMGYLAFLAAFEANLLATHAGLSLEALDAVTSAGGALTGPMRAFLGLHRADTDRNAPAFQQLLRGITDLAEKDLALTLEYARECGISLPGSALCQQLMARVYGLEDPKRR